MKATHSILRRSLMLAAALLATFAAHAKTPSYTLTSEPFPIEKATQIPGHTLKPGAYTIRIVDDFKDRFILRVDDKQGKPQATFIGLHNPDFAPFVALHQQGPIFWTASPRGTASVRAFSFPGGNTLEFVYPKGEAVALAKLNTNSVPAIDPESEGRKPDPNLSPEDREVVTLWMLTSTRVGSKEETPAIEARRFVSPAEPAAVLAEQAHATPLSPSASTPRATAPRATEPVGTEPVGTEPVGTRIARNDPPPPPSRASDPPARIHAKVVRLPQTASQLPLLLLSSFLFFMAALGLHLRRRIA